MPAGQQGDGKIMNDSLKAILSVALPLAVAGVIGALTDSVLLRATAAVIFIVFFVLSAITYDLLWWGRKSLWMSGHLWINAFGLHGSDAPPLIWQRMTETKEK